MDNNTNLCCCMIFVHGGVVVSMVLSFHHLAGGFLCGVYMFSTCLRGFYPSNSASSQYTVTGVINDSKVLIGVNGCVSL